MIITKWIGYEKIWPWFLSDIVTIKLSGASKNLGDQASTDFLAPDISDDKV
jgi:hypothetical protein